MDKGTPDQASLTERSGWLAVRSKANEEEPDTPINRDFLSTNAPEGDFTLETKLDLGNQYGLSTCGGIYFNSAGGWVMLRRHSDVVELPPEMARKPSHWKLAPL